MSSFTVTSEPDVVAKSPVQGSLGTPPSSNTSSKLHINAAPWSPNGNPAISAQAATNTIPGVTTGLRQALCPNFMAHGSCMDSACRYAHCVDELDHTGQMNLMTMMSNGQGSPAWGQGASNGWGSHQARMGGGYGARHGGSGTGSHNASMQDDGIDDGAHGPSMRRMPGQARATARPAGSHNTSGSSIAASGAEKCPPSPGSDSEISSVSNASGTDGLTASSHQSGSGNTTSIPPGAPLPAPAQQQAPGNYGPHTSPFIKSQMYYSQSSSKVTLPERCRYPHPTPGTYYDYLNVKTSVTRPEIERKYSQWRDDGYKKAMQIDQDKADAMDRLIVDAKNVLCSEKMRVEYDAMLPKTSVSAPFRDSVVTPGTTPTKASHPIGPAGSNAGALPLAPIYSEGGLW